MRVIRDWFNRVMGTDDEKYEKVVVEGLEAVRVKEVETPPGNFFIRSGLNGSFAHARIGGDSDRPRSKLIKEWVIRVGDNEEGTIETNGSEADVREELSLLAKRRDTGSPRI